MDLAYFLVSALILQGILWARAAFRPTAGRRIHRLFAQGLCIDCRYDLAGLGMFPRCPECGRLYETAPTESHQRYRFRRRLLRQAPELVVLSAALLAVTPVIVSVAYYIPPAAMGFTDDRFWGIAIEDAASAATPFIPWIMVALAPCWLSYGRPRHLPRRLILGWLVSVGAALGCGIVHSRALWS